MYGANEMIVGSEGEYRSEIVQRCHTLEIGRHLLEKDEAKEDPEVEKIKGRMNVSRVC